MGRIEYEDDTLIDLKEAQCILGISRAKLYEIIKLEGLTKITVPRDRKTYLSLRDVRNYLRAPEDLKKLSLLVGKLASRVDEIERKIDWALGQLPTPAEEYEKVRRTLEKNHPQIFR